MLLAWPGPFNSRLDPFGRRGHVVGIFEWATCAPQGHSGTHWGCSALHNHCLPFKGDVSKEHVVRCSEARNSGLCLHLFFRDPTNRPFKDSPGIWRDLPMTGLPCGHGLEGRCAFFSVMFSEGYPSSLCKKTRFTSEGMRGCYTSVSRLCCSLTAFKVKL